ncbi:MAG: 3-phosphoshikimate 1-carboxyvinyltransferase, partial [Bacteroidetes bacterium]|nr:3-phosphoshikimate 1-carboxyvinyltransferase [Bacteroidota bacterium]
MPDTIDIAPGKAYLKGKILLPLSKSISNRLLIMHFLSHGKVSPGSLSSADDTILMGSLLRIISSGSKHEPVILDTQNAGTVFRFITAVASIVPGKWLLTGDERMKHRPVQALVDALKDMGADIEYTGEIG